MHYKTYLPGKYFAISAHLLPRVWWSSYINLSSCSDQAHFFISGFRWLCHLKKIMDLFNPIAFRKAKIVYNFGLSECNRVKPIND